MKVLIIIPAYNEEKSIERVVNHLTEVCPGYDYLIVNDGSTDQTKAICEKNQYHVLNLPENRGLSASVHEGMKYAAEHDYDMAMQFDADGQHLPEYIDGLVNCMEDTGCDIVIASRFKGVKMPARMRTIGGKMITAAIHLTTGKYITDPTSGMRLYRKNVIRLFAQSRKNTPEPDTIAFLLSLGANVQEVKVEMDERTEGQSYLTPINATKYMLRVLFSILVLQWFRDDRKTTKEMNVFADSEQDDMQAFSGGKTQ